MGDPETIEPGYVDVYGEEVRCLLVGTNCVGVSGKKVHALVKVKLIEDPIDGTAHWAWTLCGLEGHAYPDLMDDQEVDCGNCLRDLRRRWRRIWAKLDEEETQAEPAIDAPTCADCGDPVAHYVLKDNGGRCPDCREAQREGGV